MFEEQKRTTLKTHALAQIRRAIQSGRLRPGDRIVEGELAREMNVSRLPVREALVSLEKEGLVVTIPFKGSYIARFGEKDLEEIYSLRGALEELALRILMEQKSSDIVSKLESVLKSMEEAALHGKKAKLISEDLRFHRTICELSNHKKLLDVWLALENQLKVFIALEESLREGSQKLVETHYSVLEAIRKGDTELAEKSVRSHFAEALNLLKQNMSGRMATGK